MALLLPVILLGGSDDIGGRFPVTSDATTLPAAEHEVHPSTEGP
jgi:hypothetical protein